VEAFKWRIGLDHISSDNGMSLLWRDIPTQRHAGAGRDVIKPGRPLERFQEGSEGYQSAIATAIAPLSTILRRRKCIGQRHAGAGNKKWFIWCCSISMHNMK